MQAASPAAAVPAERTVLGVTDPGAMPGTAGEGIGPAAQAPAEVPPVVAAPAAGVPAGGVAPGGGSPQGWREPQPARPMAREDERRRQIAVGLGIVVALGAAAGVAGAVALRKRRRAIAPVASVARAQAATQARAAGAGPAAAHRPAFDRSQFRVLRNCRCRNGEAGQVVQLAVKTELDRTERRPTGVSHTLELTYLLDHGVEPPFVLPRTRDVAPPSHLEARGFGVGMACDGDTVVVASDARVTAWSLAERRARWSQPLGGTYPSRNPVPATGFHASCDTIAVRDGVIRVPLRNGQPVWLRVADGARVAPQPEAPAQDGGRAAASRR